MIKGLRISFAIDDPVASGMPKVAFGIPQVASGMPQIASGMPQASSRMHLEPSS